MGGGGKWTPRDWTDYTDHTNRTKPTVDHIYTSKTLDSYLNPKSIQLRESRDSEANPNSTPLIVAFDETGSMSTILDALARHSLGVLVQEIHDRKVIPDPHILIMGVGDAECDRAPLQVTQFEAQVKPLVEQMEKIWLERGGGGNRYESYALAWLFAALYTQHDSFQKRGKRGYLFTIGDELPTPILRAQDVGNVLHDAPQTDLLGRQVLDMASQTYEVFHVNIEQGNHSGVGDSELRQAWADMLGQRYLSLPDHTKLAETIVSAIQICEGADKKDVLNSWSGDTSLVVAKAVADLHPALINPSSTGLVRL
jgi:hypothetical protein